VFARYLHIAFDWTEELARILFLGSMMIGIALAIRRREHIVVDFLFATRSRRTQAVLSILFDAATLVLLAIWMRGALRLMQLNVGTTFVTVPWLPVSALYAVEAFGIGLMALFVVADLIRQGQVLREETQRNDAR
jgi:TRAP-type C4-dicarboxylate transport system permease small subunit